MPGHRLALVLGIHHSKLSALINANAVPATDVNIERLERIANAVGFPKTQLFLNGDSRA
jgi:plasmid maintenance system antidote protein VapI